MILSLVQWLKGSVHGSKCSCSSDLIPCLETAIYHRSGHEKKSRRVDARGCGEEERESVLKGYRILVGENGKFLEMDGAIVTQRCAHNYCHRTAYLKMVKMANLLNDFYFFP